MKSKRISRNYIKKILIFFATYNESENIEKLLEKTFDNLPDNQVLVIDDNSPDGTGRKLEVLSKNHKQINVIHRPKKLGLGTAHKLGMQYAIKNKFDILITMDADFSHDPKYLPTMIELMNENDFVIGSRYTKGGGLGYGFFRKSLSISANILTRFLLQIPLKECTTSYRGFQVSLLRRINLNSIKSEGYSFFIEFIFTVHNLTEKITEFPIFFYDRKSGNSKISKVEILNSILCLIKLFYIRVFGKKLKFKDTFKKETSFKPCPNCTSPFQTKVDAKAAFYQENYMNDIPVENLQCLQCGKIFIC